MRRVATWLAVLAGKLVIILVCQLAHLLATLWMLATAISGNERYWTITRGYDRTGNGMTGGKDTETISSRASRARAEKRVWGCVLCGILDRIEPDHCKKSEGT